MEYEHFALNAMAKEINEDMKLSSSDNSIGSYVAPSPYDVAWLAMVVDENDEPGRPVFQECLNWILQNQTQEGCWGDVNGSQPTIETLPSTLACLVALKKNNLGDSHVDRGLAYITRNTEKLLEEDVHETFPRWFVIMFLGMLELAHQSGLKPVFSPRCKRKITNICFQRQKILKSEKLVEKFHSPLLSYLEALPSTYFVSQEDILSHLKEDGSLFQSPSATAKSYMLTVDKRCLAFLKRLVQQCGHGGVPQAYPLDKELVKLCFANRVLNLGLAEYFGKEIEEILAEVYKNYEKRGGEAKPITISVAERLLKDSISFRMLRIHGYTVSPRDFCWFLKDHEIKDHLEANHEYLWPVVLSIYRATDLMFPGEDELEDARSFSRTLLEKNKTQKTIGDELKHPWIARLEHLDHRNLIEDEDSNALWLGKASFLRMDDLHYNKLSELAVRNFHFRQSIYRNELEELKMWTKKWGLDEMGFGRKKTTYCYYATAASIPLPRDSSFRIIAAKSGILVTVADDFFDMEGSLDELKALTSAVQRWDGGKLNGISRIIFNALDDLLQNITEESLRNASTDTTFNLRRIWGETFGAWLKEAEWSKTGYIPSMEEYLETGIISIAAHTVALSASCVSNPGSSNEHLQMENFPTLTKLLMLLPRLLNDLQSYMKEQEQGKINSVLLHLKANPELEIEDSIFHIKGIISEKRKELLELVLMKQTSDLPKSCKNLHLSCHKVFEMFFDSSNRFDSDTEMLQDIQKALYDPITTGNRTSKQLEKPKTFTRPYEAVKTKHETTKSCMNVRLNAAYGRGVVASNSWSEYRPLRLDTFKNTFVPSRSPICYI